MVYSQATMAQTPDTTAPTIDSIVRYDPTDATTDEETVTFRVTFSEDVVNVSVGDFTLMGTGALNSSIDSVTAITQAVYDVVVNTADGTLSLIVRTANDNIEDLAGNAYDDLVTATEAYTIAQLPVITITADDKTDTQAITDVTIEVTDDTGITAANVTVDSSSTVTASALSCTQTSDTQVDCTITIDGEGTLVIAATDDAGNATTESEEDFVISADVDIDAPYFEVDDDDERLSKRSKNRSTDRSVKFSGTVLALAGGEVKIYDDNDRLGTASIASSDGDWGRTITFKDGKTYDLEFKFYDEHGTKIETKKTYRLFVDSEDPKFTDLPSKLTKYSGQRIWWTATDNDEVKKYRYFWMGKKYNTTTPQFVVPVGTPRGTYELVVRAYDKTGNRTDKKVQVTVR